MEGNGSISYANGEKLICIFVGGVPNGPAKLFDSENQIKQVGVLMKGQWSGHVWYWLQGGSYITGKVIDVGSNTFGYPLIQKASQN